MTDLVAFLKDRLDEDEQMATAPSSAVWASPEWRFADGDDGPFVDLGTNQLAVESGLNAAELEHMARQDPARTLREVEAARAVLDLYEEAGHRMDRAMRDADTVAYQEARVEHRTLRRVLLREAAVHQAHPAYLEEWRP